MPEILLNKETFEGLNSRFESVFSNALEAAELSHKAESARGISRMYDLNLRYIQQDSDNIRHIMQMIVTSFSETDSANKEAALKIRDVYVGPGDSVHIDGVIPIGVSFSDIIAGGGGGGGGGHAFGDGDGGGGFRGSGGNIVTAIWDSIKELPQEIAEGWKAARNVTAWYDSLPEGARSVVEKVASAICNTIDKDGTLSTSLQMVHDVFSANSVLEGAEKLIDTVGKAGGKILKAAAGASGAFGAAITVDCAMLADYAKGLVKSTIGAVNGETNAGKMIQKGYDYAEKAADAIVNGNWGEAGKYALKGIGNEVGGSLLTVFDGAAEGAAYIYDGLAKTTKGILGIFGGGGSFGKAIVDSLKEEADSLRNFV